MRLLHLKFDCVDVIKIHLKCENINWLYGVATGHRSEKLRGNL